VCQHAGGGLDEHGRLSRSVEASTTFHDGHDLPVDGVWDARGRVPWARKRKTRWPGAGVPANIGTVWTATHSVIRFEYSSSRNSNRPKGTTDTGGG
jgi:hypothetical protein